MDINQGRGACPDSYSPHDIAKLLYFRYATYRLSSFLFSRRRGAGMTELDDMPDLKLSMLAIHHLRTARKTP